MANQYGLYQILILKTEVSVIHGRMVGIGNSTNALSVVCDEDLGSSRWGLCVGLLQDDGYDNPCEFLKGESSA